MARLLKYQMASLANQTEGKKDECEKNRARKKF